MNERSVQVGKRYMLKGRLGEPDEQVEVIAHDGNGWFIIRLSNGSEIMTHAEDLD